VKIASEAQALEILKSMNHNPELRVRAVRYLGQYPTTTWGIQSLIAALQDDDFGVQWEAAEALAKCGQVAAPEMLKALTDPKRVSDPRVRRGISHALHESHDSELKAQTADLVEALRGPAAPIAAMMAASALLLKWQKNKAGQARSNIGRPAN